MSNSGAILIVSKQNVKLKRILKANIQHEGLSIDLLNNGTKLFEYLTQQSYTLLIIDLDLLSAISPDTPFFTQIRAISPNIAVILLAAEEKRSEAIEQLQQGADDFLRTPINARELILKVIRTLEIQALKQNPFPLLRQGSGIDELLQLNEATQEILQTLELDEALKIVLAKARQVTKADLVKIYLTDQKGDLSRDKSLIKTSPLSHKPREDFLLFSLAQQSAVTLKIASHKKTSDQEWQQQSLASGLIIPMVSREKLIGVLALGSIQPSFFSAYHIQWLSVFCNQAAIAVENARLFQDLSSAYIDLAQSREKILNSRNTLQVLFNGITDGLYILDQELTIIALNQIEAERQGFEPSELVGQSYLSLEWANAAPDLLNQIKDSLKTGRKTTWISPENETEPYLKDREFRIYPIRNRLAQIEQVVVFAQDVSERRQWQASLFRSANLAAVGQLAGSVAHQINNPLTVTMTNSQLLLLDTDPQTEAHELTTGIFKAGERIQNIVANLLEFSNQERYFFIQTDLIDTIEGALALVIRSLRKAQIQVTKDYQYKPVLSASVSHLKLVWVNLLLNARDAMINQSDQPQIIISTSAVSEREVKVSITDNGSGIREKESEQLFRPFFTTKPVGKALGLGLYSAHAIIQRHNGQIKAFSQPGIATTFEVILPLDNPRDL